VGSLQDYLEGIAAKQSGNELQETAIFRTNVEDLLQLISNVFSVKLLSSKHYGQGFTLAREQDTL
jgi:hypothetical protein